LIARKKKAIAEVTSHWFEDCRLCWALVYTENQTFMNRLAFRLTSGLPGFDGGAALAALLLLVVASSRLGAQSSKDDAHAVAIKIDVDVVSLYCTVHNKMGGLVNTLTKGNFELTEDGKPQTIKYFSRETDSQLTVGLLVDVSGSQRNLIEVERRAASQFFSSVLKQKDAAFLISFGADWQLLQDITRTPGILQQGLGRMKLNTGLPNPAPGSVAATKRQSGTVLFDAVYIAVHTILGNENGRRAIILITDGEDNGSRLGMKQAIEAAQRADTIIYGILYLDRAVYSQTVMAPGGAIMGYTGESVLKQMAAETGGRLFTVDGRNSLDSIFGQIEEEMRTQYLIGYTSTNPVKDGSFRKVGLRTNEKDMKVQVREGYYATTAN
jgi:VWFA-related protein